MSAILLGYDVESFAIGEGLARIGEHGLHTALQPESCTRALELITEMHEELEVRGTLFVCGRTLLHNLPALRRAAAHPLLEIQQHTYSHVLFKPDDWKGASFVASSPDALRHEVTATSALLREHLGVECTGLRTPHGYHLGVGDQPATLSMLWSAGIRYVSSWGRNEQGGQPTPLDRQPFWYDAADYPDLLEIPFQGWLDGTWFEAFGPKDADGFSAVLCERADEAADRDLVFGTCFHDWALLHYHEREERWLRRFLERVRERGVPILS
ncbi:MAG TPA: polysaccharide deacetylase family protein, partial [Acidimicrobiales bacterium]|nr:polysaccharide deacetylase family protein [Acidimicrobiales bacterium]